MKFVVFTLIGAVGIVSLCLLCACGGSERQTTQNADIGTLCKRFSTNAPSDRIETSDRILAYLQTELKGNQATNLTTEKIRGLLGKPDKETETIQTDGSILVWRYQLDTDPKSGGQYAMTDALVLRFKSDILDSIAKQKGWVLNAK